MFERSILTVQLVEQADADTPALRDRLKANFPPGTTRRMTTLGMMVGSAIQGVASDDIDALVYSSAFGESISLESYLRSFPTPSPTLFQTSIHPSGIQQRLVLRQRPMHEVIPIAGGPELVLQSALAAMTAPSAKVVWCGGEERGTWLRELGAAADRSFAFALRLGARGDSDPVGKITLVPARGGATLGLSQWFDLLHDRKNWNGLIGSGWALSLTWV